MTTSGWIIMSLSVCTVTVLFVWCIWRVLTLPGEEQHMHGFEFQTPVLNSDRDPN